jgi:hypothetical protein
VYRQKLVKLPRPEFLVLYNGTESFPDEKELKLSDAFMDVDGYSDNRLELTVKVYNVNKGHNEEIVKKSEALRGYVEFVDKVREYQKQVRRENLGIGEKGILVVAIGYCKGHGILGEFWQRLTNEEVNMLATEWSWEDALAVREEEAREEGKEEVAESALREGCSIELVQKITGLSIKRIKELLQDVVHASVV